MSGVSEPKYCSVLLADRRARWTVIMHACQSQNALQYMFIYLFMAFDNLLHV